MRCHTHDADLGQAARRAVLCLAGALVVLAFAMKGRGEPPVLPKPQTYVTDRAGVLGDAVARSLEADLRAFEAATSNQLLVYIEPEVPGDSTLEEVTVAAAQAWGVGEERRKNGVVLFVFPRSRAVRIEVGYGLEGALPDALASRIVRDEMVPRFAKGEWNAGVLAGAKAVMAATKGEYEGTGKKKRTRARGGGLPPEVFLLLVFFVLPLLFGRRQRGFWWLGSGGFGGGSFGGWSGGGGGFTGGGGSFGGGGASGRW